MRRLVLLALFAAACSRTPRGGELGKPRRADAGLELPALPPGYFIGPLAKWRVTVAPGAGHYTQRTLISIWELVTMEHTESRNGRSNVALGLEADGSAHACLGVKVTSAGSSRTYHDGTHTDHHSESHDNHGVGYTGTWRRDGSMLTLTFSQSFFGCDLAQQPPAPITDGFGELVCFGLAPPPGDAGLTTALVCRLTDKNPYFQADHFFPLATDGSRWLLLGSPGLELPWHADRSTGLDVKASAAIPDDDWDKP